MLPFYRETQSGNGSLMPFGRIYLDISTRFSLVASFKMSRYLEFTIWFMFISNKDLDSLSLS